MWVGFKPLPSPRTVRDNAGWKRPELQQIDLEKLVVVRQIVYGGLKGPEQKSNDRNRNGSYRRLGISQTVFFFRMGAFLGSQLTGYIVCINGFQRYNDSRWV